MPEGVMVVVLELQPGRGPKVLDPKRFELFEKVLQTYELVEHFALLSVKWF